MGVIGVVGGEEGQSYVDRGGGLKALLFLWTS